MAVADSTYEALWKELLVYAPECPIPIAQRCVNRAYSRALAVTGWAGQKKTSGFIIPAPVTQGTIAIVQDSATVTGTLTDWDSSLIGYQLLVARQGPYYTITAVAGSTSLTIDRVYPGATISGSTYSIEKNYITMPTDFGSLTDVLDLNNKWRLYIDYRQDQLDTIDVARVTTGSPWIVAAVPFDSTGLQRYEMWPRATSAMNYSFNYLRQPALLSAASDRPIYPIRGDVLREGAFAELALWPGPSKMVPNPYHDLGQHRMHEERFWKGIFALELKDQDISQTNITYSGDGFDPAPIGASFLQSHGGWPII